jgi:glucosamine-phosphate N-acetyltransferase
MNFMKERGIMTSQVHGRCDKHTTVKQFKCDLPQLDELEKKIVCIPCGWWIEQADAAFIVESIKEWCALNDNIQIHPLDVERDWQGYLNLITLLNKQDATNYDKETFITKYNQMQSQSSTVYVMHKGEKIVGTGKLHIETKFFDSIGHIEDVVIDPEYRKLNLGKKLVQFLVDIALNDKLCYKAILNANENVTDFYKKCDLSVDGCTVSQTYRLES